MASTAGRSRIARRASLAGLVLVALALAVWWVPDPWGHTIPAAYAPNHGADFDFRALPCAPAPRPAAGSEDVLVRYLGVAGLYVEWRGVGLLTAPYFSGHGLWRAGFGAAGWDAAAIGRGIAGVPLERVRAVLVGHAHYDHLADLPPILLERLPAVPLLVNRSGARILAAFPRLDGRIVELESVAARWLRLRGPDGEELPWRVCALPSGHARHALGYRFARGEVDEPWTTWEGRRLAEMREGRPFAFLIDALAADGATPLFRIHYQDTASDAPLGFPSARDVAERAADLVVVCMPAAWRSRDYPRGILARTRARHALIAHYEDFFRPAGSPLRFVGFLTDARAERLLEQIRTEMSSPSHVATGPLDRVCGPSAAAWSMPVPGEWLRFRATAPPVPQATRDILPPR